MALNHQLQRCLRWIDTCVEWGAKVKFGTTYVMELDAQGRKHCEAFGDPARILIKIGLCSYTKDEGLALTPKGKEILNAIKADELGLLNRESLRFVAKANTTDVIIVPGGEFNLTSYYGEQGYGMRAAPITEPVQVELPLENVRTLLGEQLIEAVVAGQYVLTAEGERALVTVKESDHE